MVERTEALRNEAIDRLSPLNSSVNTFSSFPDSINDSNSELTLEKFVDMDIDTHQLHQMDASHELSNLTGTAGTALTATVLSAAAAAAAAVASAASASTAIGGIAAAAGGITAGVNYSHLGTNVTTVSGSTRRHTVGPGDVEHEQALANPSAVPINFKFGTDNAPRLPVNLPMMQNQPLHNFTIKNQHLLKLPTVMEASTLNTIFSVCFSVFVTHSKSNEEIPFHFERKKQRLGSFGRRASDGGANLQIYYTTTVNSGQSVEPIYGNSANAKDLRIGVDSMQQQHNDNMSIAMDGNDEQSDEIQRYVHRAMHSYHRQIACLPF